LAAAPDATKAAADAAAAAARGGKRVMFGRSPLHAWGLYAAEPAKPGEFIMEYTGLIIRAELLDARERYYESRGQDSSYMFRCAAICLCVRGRGAAVLIGKRGGVRESESAGWGQHRYSAQLFIVLSSINRCALITDLPIN
jgi:hypothetical protein